jgi:nucleotide-binding universal stress UspA family protein
MLPVMHVLVATAGSLSPHPVVEFARHLIGGTGLVTLATVVEVPRSFLEEINQVDWHPLRDGHTVPSSSADDVVVAQYLEERAHRLTEPIRLALEQAKIPCEILVLEGTDAAAEISRTASELDVDVVVLGATKQIFDRDAWESVSSRVMLESGKAVLVVPEAKKDTEEIEILDEFDQISESSVSA